MYNSFGLSHLGTFGRDGIVHWPCRRPVPLWLCGGKRPVRNGKDRGKDRQSGPGWLFRGELSGWEERGGGVYITDHGRE